MKLFKSIMMAGAAIAALSSSAYSADMPVKAARMAAPAPAYNWTSLYIGAHVGGAFPGSDFFGNDDARLMAGLQIGFDYQLGSAWVIGAEANYSFMDSGNQGVNFFNNRNLGSVTGRLGYTWGPTMLYAKGGYAWADTRRSFGFAGSGDDGYTVGGGIEHMFAPNWSAKLEYQYYDFGNLRFTSAAPVVVTNFRNDEHTIKLGLNYRFNWGAPGGRPY